MTPLTVLERAHLYADKVPPAVQGQRGSDATFALAVKLVCGFDLTPNAAYPVMEKWNRLCVPPWNEQQLRHKLKDADKRTESRGSMLEKRQETYRTPVPRKIADKPKPDLSGFATTTWEQTGEIVRHRAYAKMGLLEAAKRMFLMCGKHRGFECYMVTDRTGKAAACRRIDNQPIPLGTESKKSLFLPNSDPHWPIGTLESIPFPCIALFEGVPDFIEGCHVILWEGAEARVAPVMMLSASPSICETALPHFKNKTIRIFSHPDKAGVRGAEKWRQQLIKAKAAKVDFFDFGTYKMPNGSPVEDFYELQRVYVERCLP